MRRGEREKKRKRRGKEEEKKRKRRRKECGYFLCLYLFYFLPIHSPERSEASIRKIGV
jgi:hypothetical protein